MSAVSVQRDRPARRIGAWTLQLILAAAFLAAGSAKLAGVPFMVDCSTGSESVSGSVS
jgi:putative oxidoreductase